MKKVCIWSILLLTSHFSLLTSVYSYSLFSGGGLGEPVGTQNAVFRGMGGMPRFELPEELTFECSFLADIGKDFTLPNIRYVLPLPSGLGIDLGLNELLNLNFGIESPWEEFHSDSVQRRVKGQGSASIGKVGIGKNFSRISGSASGRNSVAVELGGFVVFGSSMEEWVTDFKSMHDAYDTLKLKFSGTGWMGSMRLEIGRFDLSASYLSSSELTHNTDLPSRFGVSIFHTPVQKVTLGIGMTSWQWEEPFKQMTRYSLGGELEFSQVILRGGFYTGNWYYGNIEERVGSLGIGIPFKSLLMMGLSFEFGKRWSPILEERVYRACITLQGKE